MKIPIDTDDKEALARYIRGLIKEDKIELFYKTDDWLELRAEVKEEQHNECQYCKAKGKITLATTVHHEKEVKIYPHLALSKTYIDEEGKERTNLNVACDGCHNKEHKRFLKAEERPQLNIERW